MDLKLKNDKETIIIKMNNDYYEFLQSKNYQYLFREAGSMYDVGEDYSDKKTKLILFNNFKKVCYDSDEVDVSLSLFSATSFDEMRKLTKNPKDIEIIEELERLAMDEEFKIHYDQEAVRRKTENSIRKESYEKGLEFGLEQGKEKKQAEIAESMLNDGVSIENISKYTGLSIEELNRLKIK